VLCPLGNVNLWAEGKQERNRTEKTTPTNDTPRDHKINSRIEKWWLPPSSSFLSNPNAEIALHWDYHSGGTCRYPHGDAPLADRMSNVGSTALKGPTGGGDEGRGRRNAKVRVEGPMEREDFRSLVPRETKLHEHGS